MKILFDKTAVLGHGECYVAVDGEYISYIGKERPSGEFDRVIGTKNKLICPALYNCHTHSAMQFLRGYGEDLPLDRWLNERIFPAEDRLTPKIVYISSKFAIAEMIKNGICSFSDMYYFCDKTAEAVGETGIKANISRSIVSFDNSANHSKDNRFLESVELYNKFHNAFDGRLKVEFSLHAEYTNVPSMVKYVADYASGKDIAFQIHLSETEKEHNECIGRHGITPTEFFECNGILECPTSFAHCVWLTDNDMDILKRYNSTVVHNPVSNLKLGSGVMRLSKMLEKGINVSLGTDSSASNNTLDILKEINFAALLQKGTERDPSSVKAEDIIKLATENGAKCQNREDCGVLAVGKKADIIMIDTDRINNIPSYSPVYTLVYSANSSDVCFNMVDGKVLYENGEYKTLDIERLKHEMKELQKDFI
ncbi:MAG: amidohydrolase [Ruminococcaceae bacterium]|nr:amidohydrolase [Oscillospiraceae bacterium]